MKTQSLIHHIERAIALHTGLALRHYATPSRRQTLVYARMHFAHHLHAHSVPTALIAQLLQRTPSAVGHLLRRHPDELRFNAPFRAQAQAIAHTLSHLHAPDL